MRKESAPCSIINSGDQGAGERSETTTQRFLLDNLGFIADSQLLGITIAGAYEVRSETLTTGISTEVTLESTLVST